MTWDDLARDVAETFAAFSDVQSHRIDRALERRALRRRIVVTPDRVAPQRPPPWSRRPSPWAVTERERTVALLCCDGVYQHEIAIRVGLSRRGVEYTLHRLRALGYMIPRRDSRANDGRRGSAPWLRERRVAS